MSSRYVVAGHRPPKSRFAYPVQPSQEIDHLQMLQWIEFQHRAIVFRQQTNLANSTVAIRQWHCPMQSDHAQGLQPDNSSGHHFGRVALLRISHLPAPTTASTRRADRQPVARDLKSSQERLS